jgi:hypothetical protein
MSAIYQRWPKSRRAVAESATSPSTVWSIMRFRSLDRVDPLRASALRAAGPDFSRKRRLRPATALDASPLAHARRPVAS